MAKKGNRVQVILECTEHKDSGKPGTSRYITTKNRKNTPDKCILKDHWVQLTFPIFIPKFEYESSISNQIRCEAHEECWIIGHPNHLPNVFEIFIEGNIVNNNSYNCDYKIVYFVRPWTWSIN